MLLTIYPISYMVCLFGLIMWFYFKDNGTMSRLMGSVFFLGMATYLTTFYLSEGELTYKLMVLARDLGVMGAVAYFFGAIAKNKLVFFAFLALLYGALQYKFTQVLEQTFPQSSATLTGDFSSEGELLVEMKPGYTAEAIADILKKYDLTASTAFEPYNKDLTDLDDYLVIDVPPVDMKKLEKIIRLLKNDAAVEWVELNDAYMVDPMETTPVVPSRKHYRDLKKFGLNDPNLKDLWGFQELRVDELYKLIKKKKIKPVKKARIFILDTGVDAKHEDLKYNYKSINRRYDKDPMGHGTHCAGIAAAVSNNGIGTASFSQNNEFVQVTSIRVLGSHGGGTQRGILKGIIEAADNGADVISMSLGGRSDNSKQKAYQEAIEYANKKGAIVIAAAGNSNDNAKFYAPANAPGAITVTAIDPDMNRAAFSNYIQEVDYGIAAPGVNIYSSIPGDKYAFFNGTSMATPYVAGLVGLMKSVKPELTTKQAHDILTRTGIKTGNTKETGRFIQPAKAMEVLMGKFVSER